MDFRDQGFYPSLQCCGDLFSAVSETFAGVRMLKKALQNVLIGMTFAGLAAPAALHAQSGETMLQSRFPELANYLNASEVLQATVFEEIALTNESPDSAIGKNLLRESLVELTKANYSHYHTSADHLAMLGPHRLAESRATPGIQALVREEYTAEEIERALLANGSIPPRAMGVLRRGREFAEQLLDIYLNDAIYDKHGAIDEALANYLSNDELSVAALPKSSDLLSEHQYAYAFRVGFPQLSGMTWASQWLQLATLEITMMASSQAALEAGIQNVTDLYVEKIARAHGSMMSLPTDIPTMPVIAPNVYSFHPGAAYVIDNISALKVVIGDILAHPDVPDRSAAIEDMVEQFTTKEEFLDEEMNYLTFVLRGGIFNQGGPALGGMEQSERNRSRVAVEQSHISNYPMAQ